MTESTVADEPERWLPVPGFEGIYEASDLGRVRSLDRVTLAGRPITGRVLRSTPGRVERYPHVTLCGRDVRPKPIRVHQVILLTFVGPQASGTVVRHLDGDPMNNRLDNLVYGSYSDNAHDRTRHGRDPHANRTHCIHGHELTPENTYIVNWSDGAFKQRLCKPCYLARAKKWREKQPPCTVPGCPNPQLCKKICKTHYYRQLRERRKQAVQGTLF